MLPFYLFAFLMSVNCVQQHLTKSKSIIIGNFENRTEQYQEIDRVDEDRFDTDLKVRIPYYISKRFSEYHREIILKGLEDYERFTCLKFEKVKPADRKLQDFLLYFRYVPEAFPECNNTHYLRDDGQYNSKTIIRLNEKLCLNDSGRVKQLIFSALGFIHEDTRSDRDDHVIVLWENIIPGHESYFSKVKEGVKNWILPYDYFSVSNHYPDFHSKNGQPTLAWKDSNRSYERNIQLSLSDVYKINGVFCRNYNTSEIGDKEVFNQFGKFRVPVSFIDDVNKTNRTKEQ